MKVTLETTVAAPTAELRQLFRDVERWPRWMPGMRSVTPASAAETSDRQPDDRQPDDQKRTILLEQEVAGRVLHQTAVVTATPTGLVQRRLDGEPKRWILDWSFEPAPGDPQATTARVAIDADFGLWSRVTPRRLIERALDDTFHDLVEAAASALAPAVPPDAAILFRGVSSQGGRLQITRSADGALEVVFDGARYRALDDLESMP